MHIFGANQLCGHTDLKGTRAWRVHLQGVLPCALQSATWHTQKGRVHRHTDARVLRTFQNRRFENEWSHIECGQEIFSITPNPKGFHCIFRILCYHS